MPYLCDQSIQLPTVHNFAVLLFFRLQFSPKILSTIINFASIERYRIAEMVNLKGEVHLQYGVVIISLLPVLSLQTQLRSLQPLSLHREPLMN